MSDLHNLRDALDDALQGSVPDDLKAKGWRYQDFNAKFSPQAWGFLLRLLGEGEYRVICMSQGKSNDGPWVRGQFFISPQGYRNLKDQSRRDQLKD